MVELRKHFHLFSPSVYNCNFPSAGATAELPQPLKSLPRPHSVSSFVECSSQTSESWFMETVRLVESSLRQLTIDLWISHGSTESRNYVSSSVAGHKQTGNCPFIIKSINEIK